MLSRESSAHTYGAEAQNRTGDTRIFSPLLYQLSYLGITPRIIQVIPAKINDLLGNTLMSNLLNKDILGFLFLLLTCAK